MLIFLSDTHLTDGSTCETISADAFGKLVLMLEDMAKTANSSDIEVVFLGDIFDVIRSEIWLSTDIRPWSPKNKTDKNSQGLKQYTMKIIDRICQNDTNIGSMQHLKNFKEKMENEHVNVKYTYITGNHDWLINRYPETRLKIADFMGINKPEDFRNQTFDDELLRASYHVFARHGDIFDPFNFDGNRDASSLGDAIVIDIINKFPQAVEKEIGKHTNPDLIKELKEIDNVRPLIDIPLWINGVSLRAKTTEIGKKIKKVWNEVVDGFLNIKFVKDHDKAWRMDMVDALQVGLRLSKFLSLNEISEIPLRKFQKTEDDYIDRAFQEDALLRNEATAIVYGHTHDYKLQPLDQVHLGGITIGKKYFNSGTWRKVHKRTAFDQKNYEFLSWHVLTLIAFYLEGERGQRSFEVWNGVLG